MLGREGGQLVRGGAGPPRSTDGVAQEQVKTGVLKLLRDLVEDDRARCDEEYEDKVKVAVSAMAAALISISAWASSSAPFGVQRRFICVQTDKHWYTEQSRSLLSLLVEHSLVTVPRRCCGRSLGG